MICKKPMKHRPEFEGKHNCTQCEVEQEATTMKTYIVKTKIGTEERVITEITARLDSAGSMEEKKAYIGNMTNPTHLKGYIFVEATEEHYLEAVLGLIKTSNSLRIKGVTSIVGEPNIEEAAEHIQPRKGSHNLEIGMVVSLTEGAWKGYDAQIMHINEVDDTLDVELWGVIAMSINNVLATTVRRI